MGVETGAAAKDGLRDYYRAKIEEYELAVRDKTQNLRRLEAQRNELNNKGARRPGRAVWNGSLRSGRPARARRGERARRDASVHPRPRRIARGRSRARHVVSRPVRTSHARLGLPIPDAFFVFADAPPPLHGAVRMLREEIHHLQEPGSYVGEVVKVMAKTKVLVKVRDVRDDHARARLDLRALRPLARTHPCCSRCAHPLRFI